MSKTSIPAKRQDRNSSHNARPGSPAGTASPNHGDVISPAAHSQFGHRFLLIAISQPPIQHQAQEEEAPLQGKADPSATPLQRQTEDGGAPIARPNVPIASGGGSPLPAPTLDKMERSFGHSFADVRVHQGDEAKQVGALAYTRGTDIHFQPGLYDPNSLGGQELLGHELTHVVQQKAGRVAKPQNKAAGSAPINADAGLEREADLVGARAARGQGIRDHISLPSGGHGFSDAGPIQRAGGKDEIKDGAAEPEVVKSETQSESIQRELEALGSGHAPASSEYLGQEGAARDARLMSMDPRLQARYQTTRASDEGGFLERKKQQFKETASQALDNIKHKRLPNSAPKVPGSSYATQDETTGDTVLRYAKKGAKVAASQAVNQIPFVKPARTLASAFQEHERQHVDERIASEEDIDPLAKNIASGLGKHHKDQKIQKGVDAAAGFVTDSFKVLHMAAPNPALDHVGKAVKYGVKGARLATKAAISGKNVLTNKERELRLASTLPVAQQDDANAPLGHAQNLDSLPNVPLDLPDVPLNLPDVPLSDPVSPSKRQAVLADALEAPGGQKTTKPQAAKPPLPRDDNKQESVSALDPETDDLQARLFRIHPTHPAVKRQAPVSAFGTQSLPSVPSHVPESQENKTDELASRLTRLRGDAPRDPDLEKGIEQHETAQGGLMRGLRPGMRSGPRPAAEALSFPSVPKEAPGTSEAELQQRLGSLQDWSLDQRMSDLRGDAPQDPGLTADVERREKRGRRNARFVGGTYMEDLSPHEYAAEDLSFPSVPTTELPPSEAELASRLTRLRGDAPRDPDLAKAMEQREAEAKFTSPFAGTFIEESGERARGQRRGKRPAAEALSFPSVPKEAPGTSEAELQQRLGSLQDWSLDRRMSDLRGDAPQDPGLTADIERHEAESKFTSQFAGTFLEESGERARGQRRGKRPAEIPQFPSIPKSSDAEAKLRLEGQGGSSALEFPSLSNDILRHEEAEKAKSARHAQVDQANEALLKIPGESHEAGLAYLHHLGDHGQMPLRQELALNRDIQKPVSETTSETKHKEGWRGRLPGRLKVTQGEAVEEHTLKPSKVAEVARSEKARLRQRERLGANASWSFEAEQRQKREEEAAQQAEIQQRKEAEKLAKKGIVPPTPVIPEAPKAPPMPEVADGPEKENVLRTLLKNEQAKFYE